jgi:hypothetical protein
MKKLILGLIITACLVACNSMGDKKTSDEVVTTDFKENSKVTMDLFHAFENKDIKVFASLIADTAKIIGAKYGDSILTKDQHTANLSSLMKLFNNSKANDIMLFPGMDPVTYKLVPSVRAYVRWTDDAVNGAKIEHKYYAVLEFNKDHKVVLIDEYFDVTGMLNASTAPKK